jgi:predicted metal-dependent phosphoesterase TrpH
MTRDKYAPEDTLGTADLHMHSRYSDGYQTIGQILTHVERNTNLDVIAITDHDCIDGAFLARDLVAKQSMRLQLIVGAEISTRDGHLLALNIEHLIPAGLSMAETIDAVHEQGGLAVVAHPTSRWCPSASMRTLYTLATEKFHAPDGVEAINASFAGVGSNNRVHKLNRDVFHWAELGGSDAHSQRAIGSGRTTFPGNTATDMLNAIRNRTTVATGGRWPTRSVVRYGVGMAVRR